MQAGLLTFGSNYFPHLPIPYSGQWYFVGFVPDYSSGAVPDFNRLPSSLKKSDNPHDSLIIVKEQNLVNYFIQKVTLSQTTKNTISQHSQKVKNYFDFHMYDDWSDDKRLEILFSYEAEVLSFTNELRTRGRNEEAEKILKKAERIVPLERSSYA